MRDGDGNIYFDPMMEPIPKASNQIRKGRWIFSVSLLLMAWNLGASLVNRIKADQAEFSEVLLVGALVLVTLVFAYRGGILAMKIVKLAVASVGLIIGLGLLLGLAAPFFFLLGDIKIPHDAPADFDISRLFETLTDDLTGVALAVGQTGLFLAAGSFVVWTVFFSKSVKAFIAYQRGDCFPSERT